MIQRLLIASFILVAACSSSTTGTDLGVVEPGCRQPSACYKVGADCACNRADVNGSCRVCDPNTQNCTCATGTQCLEASAVCVGRGAVCLGTGAGCLPAGSSCGGGSMSSPPQLVGTGAGGTLEPRCAFVDDVCCPGALTDLGVTD